MRQFLKTSVCVIAVAALAFCMAGCQKKEVKVEKPSFETQEYSDDTMKFEIPKSWSQFEGDGSGDYLVFANADADGAPLTSNVNVVYQPATSKPLTIKEMKDQFPGQYEPKITQIYPSATGFTYSDFEAPIGPVFVVGYSFDVDGTAVKQTQYYPLFNGGVIVVTATEVQDIDVNPVDAAKHIANTIEIAK